MNNIFKNFIIILLFFISAPLFSLENNDEIRKKVLLLNSYHKGFIWTDDITRGVNNALNPKDIELHIEYMDLKRQSDKSYVDLLTKILNLKHNNHEYELIITSDDDAFNFAINNRDELYPGIPIVFCGINNVDENKFSDLYNVTGVNERIDLKGNIDLIKRLHPNKKIVIITDDSTTGKKLQQQINELSTLQSNLELLYDISGNNLIKLVSQSSVDTIFLFTIFFTDNRGIYYDNMVSRLSAVSKNPIYGTWDFNLNNGIIGGILTSGFNQGKLAGEFAINVLNGANINEIPIEYNTPTKVVFDYDELVRFNMNLKDIKGYEEINRPVTFYESNKILIWIVLSILLLLTSSLFAVSSVLIKSKKTEQKLKNYKEHLEELVSQRTEKLQSSLQDLQKTQNQLVESQRMAYLGSLIAGVAHELNTPIGIGITSISHLLQEGSFMENEVLNDNLKKSKLENFLRMSKETLEISLSSLERAVQIIRIFKLVSGDKSNNIKQKINLSDFISNIIEDFSKKEENKNVHILLFCDKNIEIETLPSSVYLIFKNLFSNSYQHGFKNNDYGVINVYIKQNKENIEIKYYDSGIGIDSDSIKQIFDPFYTTNRANGNLGLGLNIVYNVIVKNLRGSIKCQDVADGKHIFIINLPT